MKKRFAVMAIAVASALLWSGIAQAAVVTGTAGSDYLFGTNDADSISGGGNSDHMYGKGGNDTLHANVVMGQSAFAFPGGGDDAVNPVPGFNDIYDDDGHRRGEFGDQLFGGAGGDVIFSADGEADQINCGGGTDTLIADPSDTDTIFGSCEYVFRGDGFWYQGGVIDIGSKRDDKLKGSDDYLSYLFGKQGDDMLKSGAAGASPVGAYMFGGPGKDRFVGGAKRDTAIDDDSTPGDVIKTGGDADTVYAADGARTVIDCGDDAGDYAVVDAIDEVVNCEMLVGV